VIKGTGAAVAVKIASMTAFSKGQYVELYPTIPSSFGGSVDAGRHIYSAGGFLAAFGARGADGKCGSVLSRSGEAERGSDKQRASDVQRA